jgi:hypothetical protein
MKRINYAEVSYLVGDDVADLLVRYTARLASSQQGDAVEVHVLGPDGNAETASFALGPGITMTAETTRSELDEPDNTATVAYLDEAMRRLTPTPVVAMTPEDLRAMADVFDGSESPKFDG